MLSLESAVTDILATVVVFVLIETIVSGQQLDAGMVGIFTLRSVLTGLLLGFGVGIPWLFVYSKLSNAAHVSMLTLGMLFVLYFLARSLGESGALTCLVFGLMLGNRQFFAKILRFKKIEQVVLMPATDPFHERITFLVRSFFFVFVGLLASFGQIEFIIVGIGIAVALFVSRIGVTKITIRPTKFLPFDRLVTTFMMPRGLAAAVLATLPLTLGLPNSGAYPQIVFMIILSSVIITTAGLFKYRRQAEAATTVDNSTSVEK
jgi:cell volume regulation protein A